MHFCANFGAEMWYVSCINKYKFYKMPLFATKYGYNINKVNKVSSGRENSFRKLPSMPTGNPYLPLKVVSNGLEYQNITYEMPSANPNRACFVNKKPSANSNRACFVSKMPSANSNRARFVNKTIVVVLHKIDILCDFRNNLNKRRLYAI